MDRERENDRARPITTTTTTTATPVTTDPRSPLLADEKTTEGIVLTRPNPMDNGQNQRTSPHGVKRKRGLTDDDDDDDDEDNNNNHYNNGSGAVATSPDMSKRNLWKPNENITRLLSDYHVEMIKFQEWASAVQQRVIQREEHLRNWAAHVQQTVIQREENLRSIRKRLLSTMAAPANSDAMGT
jgi:hypothetical protein